MESSGRSSQHRERRITPPDLQAMKRRGQPIVMVTAYDAPSARFAQAAGVDSVLVGDSAAMTMLGYDSTVRITVEEMLVLTRAVSRGVDALLVVADMPFGSYQLSDEAAVSNAIRFVKQGGAHAVKLEGAGYTVLSRIRAIIAAGMPVMGHIGLTPQTAVALGGYRAQGRTVQSAQRLRDEAVDLERAGCFAVVLEAMPPEVAGHITRAVGIPTVGIGAGPSCDGQVLVWHDLLGLSVGHVPLFVKRYADLAEATLAALRAYVSDVRCGAFPTAQHTYSMIEGEVDRLDAELSAPSGTAPRTRS